MSKHKTTDGAKIVELSPDEYDLQTLRAETAAQISALSDSLVTHREDVATLRADMTAQFRALMDKLEPTGGQSLRFGCFGAPPPSSDSPILRARGTTPSSTDGMSLSVMGGNSATSVSKTNRQPDLREDQVILGFAHEKGVVPASVPQPSLSVAAGGLLGLNTHEQGETSRFGGLMSGKQQAVQYFQHTDGGNHVSHSGAYPHQHHPPPALAFGTPNQSAHPYPKTHTHPIDSQANIAIFGPPPLPSQPGYPFRQSSPNFSHTASFPPPQTTHTPTANNTQQQQYAQHNFDYPYQQYAQQPPGYPLPNSHQAPNPNFSQQYSQYDPALPSMRQMKLELASFGGGDPIEWLHKLEQFFEFYQVPEERRLAIAAMHLVDKAADRWFMFQHEFPQSWRGLSELLMREFSVHNYGEYQAALARISQTGSVDVYMDQFTKLSRRAPGFSSQALLSFFLEGLKEPIRTHVRAHKPTTLYTACELAKLFESNVKNTHRPNAPFAGRAQEAPPRPPPQAPQRAPVAPNPSGVRNFGGNRRLTNAEYQERRARNQCFFCDELFRPGQNRRRGQAVLVMEVLQEEGAQQEGQVVEEAPVNDVEVNIVAVEEEVELRAMGDGTSSTMQLKGKILNKEVHVLIDSGATHNFVHPAALKTTKHQVVGIKPVRVRMASGEIQYTKGQVSLELTMQELTITADFYVLPVSGCEVVLGDSWLQTLGDIVWNFETKKMKFQVEERTVCLQGIVSPKASLVSSKSMTRLLRKEREAVLVKLQPSTTRDQQRRIHPAIQSLLLGFKDVFADPQSLPPSRSHDHQIELLPNTAPISVRPYRYPHFQKAEIEKIVQEMLASGIIRPSISPYSSPVLLVKKKDGTWRLCIDYRALNALTIKDKYPIPVVDELIDEVHGSTIFTKLDLRAGYHQIRMAERDIQKTAFRTHTGHYEFLVMPFGLTNAPSTFQALMNDVLRCYLRKFVLVFFDDILIYSPNLETHLQHLELVLSTLRKQSLFVKESKCNFGAPQVEYLGHIISKDGVSVDPAKIECVKQWPVPKTVKELRGFLGLAGYYRKYVKRFGIIAKPLTMLLKKEGFKWSEEATAAFEELKIALTTTPVLAFPDFSKPFTVECDASDLGVGAVLSQEGHPLAFMSKALSQRHLALSVYDKEMLAVVTAVQQWRPYLLGHHFTILTDHKTIEHFLNQRVTTSAQQKWLLKLLGYDYTIKYRKGKNNAAPDALSRSVSLQAVTGASIPIHNCVQEIHQVCTSDAKTMEIIQQLQANPQSHKHFSLQNAQLMYKGRVYVPNIGNWRQRVIQEYHCGYTGGHAGRSRTYKRLGKNFSWSGLQRDVKEFIANCHTCQLNHYETIRPPGLQQPLAIPPAAWRTITMDFIEGLPKSQGKTVIWVVVDKLTKVAHFVPLSHPYTAASLASVFISEIFRLHGMPEVIVSDRDPVFMSLFWEEFFKLQGTILSKSTAYHPQTDGQTENLNRTLEQYLRCVTGSKPQEWVKALPWAEWWYNSAHHSALQMTPFEALYGYPPPVIQPYLPGSTAVADVDFQLCSRDELLALVKRNLEQAQLRMKRHHDKHHTERTFAVGDWVYLKLQQYKQNSVGKSAFHKLASKFYGPFQVIERVGEVAYRLQLPATARIHDVFHVSLLKKKLGGTAVVEGQLPNVSDASVHKWAPEAVLQARMVKRHGAAATQWLVQWMGTSPEEATWELADEIMQRFPDFKPDF